MPGTDARRIGIQRIVVMRGAVTVTTDTAIIRAEEIDFHPDTNQAELRGNVRVELTSPPIIVR